MNDVSILLPLPTDAASPILVTIAGDAGGEPLASTGMFGALVTNTGDIAPKTGPAVTYDRMQVVAVRFDLCDRSTAGPCPVDADGRLRLVLQPVFAQPDNSIAAEDVAVHAFYTIPNADLDGVVRKLRGLAAIADAPDGPLMVSPGAANSDYLAALHELVMTYAHQSNLQQITLMGQVAQAGAFEWHMRGYTRMGAFMPIQIPGTDDLPEFQESTLISGGDITYNIDPIVDQPRGASSSR